MKQTRKTNDYLHYISKQTQDHNFDNISRTKAYYYYFQEHPEIEWAFVASLVSRNAGWNMTDLKLPMFESLLGERERWQLFMTYERANWLIFLDAYPQLLIYALSKKLRQPLFFLLEEFHISKFMQLEWKYFWKSNNKTRLVISLIINEQNVIENAVIQHPFYKTNVFQGLPYFLQNIFWMNAVIIPTKSGNIYGKHVKGFTKLKNRIQMGKEIASLLFHPSNYPDIKEFTKTIPHTGSRYDYEQFLNNPLPKAMALRSAYPFINHRNVKQEDWYTKEKMKPKWKSPVIIRNPKEISSSFYWKRKLFDRYRRFKSNG